MNKLPTKSYTIQLTAEDYANIEEIMTIARLPTIAAIIRSTLAKRALQIKAYKRGDRYFVSRGGKERELEP